MAVQKDHLEVDIKKLTDQAINYLFKLGALEVSDKATGKSVDANASVDFEQTVSTCTASKSKLVSIYFILR